MINNSNPNDTTTGTRTVYCRDGGNTFTPRALHIRAELSTLRGEYAERRKKYDIILHITPEYGISSSL